MSPNTEGLKNPELSVIIPVFNEANYIGRVLDHIIINSSDKIIKEIIVVDGGSTDNTIDIVSQFEKVILLHSNKKGRACQLNYGAKNSNGSILYFLHADSFPPKNFDEKIILEINNKNAGSFRLKFENPGHSLLIISQWLTRFNFQLFRGGDQSLFISKENFQLLNGYNEKYIIYEDIEFINRINKKLKFKVLNDFIITSERRFRKNGIWKLHFNFLMIHIRNWFGASPDELYKYYRENIDD